MLSNREFVKSDQPIRTNGSNRIYTYNQYLQARFGQRVQSVTIDAGFTCPNRDGTVASGGCTYCSNDSFSPASHTYRPKVYIKPTTPVSKQIDDQIGFLGRRYGTDKFIAYFQAFSNTYAPVDQLEALYAEALANPSIIGLTVGTRPDCVEEEKLDLFERLARTHYVSLEYGCESIYDTTLKWANRGHDFACFVDAVERTSARGLTVGAHYMLGFPTETRTEMLAAAEKLSSLPISFLKLHNLHIVDKTVLARQYAAEPFSIFRLEEYVNLVADFLERLRPDICIQRLHAETPAPLRIAPAWSTTGQEMQQLVQKELEKRNTHQGCRFCLPSA
ncbi:MAG: TIGR01212 family radical SAM protein [Bacteroidetes bacterium]|nr:TIGR01212 family radical SAM protein [Bacteroidota bacterium]